MKIKGFFLAIVCVLLANITLAAHTPSLGGISLSSTLEDVTKLYGAPEYITHETKYYTDTYYYGKNKSFIIVRSTITQTPSIDEIISTADNGIATPEGIHVGMDIDKALSIYKNHKIYDDGINAEGVHTYVIIDYTIPGEIVNNYFLSVKNNKIIKILLNSYSS